MCEFHEHLFKMGTGWLGWPAPVVLATPMPQLELAIAGRRELLHAIFGAPENKVPVGQKLKAILGMRGTTRVKREKAP